MRLHVLFVVLALGGASNPKAERAIDGASIGSTVEDASVTVILRYTNQSVVACTESAQQYRHRKLSCRSHKRWSRGAATLEFEPLQDENRRILRSDRRKAFSITLTNESRPSELRVPIQKGPWLVRWKGTTSAVRAEIGNVGDQIVASQLNGTCRVGNWRCRLDAKATERNLQFRRAQAGRSTPRF